MEQVNTNVEYDMNGYIDMKIFKADPEEFKWMNIKTDDTELKPKVGDVKSNAVTVSEQTAKENECMMKIDFYKISEKNASTAQMYKCDNCDYKTTFKSYLKQHQFVHNMCSSCTHETYLKYMLQGHQLMHKEPCPEAHKCIFCVVKTKFKVGPNPHQLIHKDPSQVQMFDCKFCKYKTKFNCDLKKLDVDLLIDRDLSGVQIFEFRGSGYKTKFHRDLKKHRSVHKGLPKIQIYKCVTCDYQTQIKSRLKVHEMIHKDPSQVPI